jgi:type I restriction enzyme M protein
VLAAMVGLNPNVKEEKRKLTALQKDKAALERRLARIDGVLEAIGGQMSEAEAKGLILKKLHDLANKELLRYLNSEKRGLVAVVENLWDKYATSNKALEGKRDRTLSELNGFLAGLGYFG